MMPASPNRKYSFPVPQLQSEDTASELGLPFIPLIRLFSRYPFSAYPSCPRLLGRASLTDRDPRRAHVAASGVYTYIISTYIHIHIYFLNFLLIGSGGGEGRKSHEDRLNGKTMTVVDRFKGGEAEWVDWKFKFLNAVGTGSKAMRRVLMWVEEKTTKGETLTAEKVVEKMQNGDHDDSFVGTFNGIARISEKCTRIWWRRRRTRRWGW